MSTVAPPPGWYPDPGGFGGQRWWNGAGWTEHAAPPPLDPLPQLPPLPPLPPYGVWPPYGGWGPPPWKGAQIGRPAAGPGSLADPARRLGAFAIDLLVMVPVFAILLTVTLLIAAPHFGPMFPNVPVNQNASSAGPPPGFVWLELCILACGFVTGIVWFGYQTVATAKFGRTLGNAALHIRPVRFDLAPLGWGRSLGRAAIFWAAGFFGWAGFLDLLWCLWDDKRQCLHDKAAGAIVIRDLE